MRDTDLARAWEAYAGDKRPDSPHRCALIVHYLDFSERLARKLHARVPRTVDVHDLAQIAAMALVTQVDTFDYTVNDRFDLYASRYITGRMLDHLRSLDPLSRHTRKVVRAVTEASTAIETAEGRPATEDEVASRTGKTVTQIRDARAKEETSRPSVYEDVATVEPARLPSPESMFMVNRVSDAVAEALEDMDFATQYIVALKYYLNQSLSSIAESTGLPETVVSRLHAKAVERVRETVVKIVVESGAEA